MAAAQILRVNFAERSYDIEIGRENLAEAGRFLTERIKPSRVVLITDDNVHRPHAMRAAESFGERDIEVDVICVEPGEAAKSLDMAAALWQGMLDLGTDRKTVVAAVGGGVIGDLAGFVAATFARGLPLLHIPTSLLAQVDSSIGGKTGVNFSDAKNTIGVFHQPLGVLIDTAALATLPDVEYRNGLAEVVKYGAALDADFFHYLEANAAALLERRPEVLTHVIARCCRLKADAVEADERDESGVRAVLNFGHTFGHAFESLCGEWGPGASGQWPVVGAEPQAASPDSLIPNPQSPIPHSLRHGEAVSIGMVCARLAERLGRIDAASTVRLRRLLETFGLPTEVPPLEPEKILDAMRLDKKSRHGRLCFVLPSRVGCAELVENIAWSDIACTF